MEAGVKECHKLIRDNSEDRQMVRIVIAALTDKTVLAQGSGNFTATGFHAAMFGYLARIFKKDMVDSLDKPASRKKTLERIVQSMIGNFFTLGNDTISNGCAISLIDIMENVFPEMLLEDQQESDDLL
jgi:hypothetical protein